jgi:hypothetical protein
MAIPLKMCYKCRVAKPLSRFSSDITRKDKLTPACKACDNLRRKDYKARMLALKEKESGTI